MARLGFCLNAIARFRNLYKERVPDPAAAAIAAEMAGVDGILVHLREDRSDITDRDVTILKDVVQSHLNLAVPLNDEMVKKAMGWLPDMVTLTPTVREESRRNSLDVTGQMEYLEDVVAALRANNIVVSALIALEAKQIRAAARIRLDFVQFNTVPLAHFEDLGTMHDYVEQLRSAAAAANKLGLGVAVGRGINYQNARELTDNSTIEEVNAGHAICARALLVGIERSVADFRALL